MDLLRVELVVAACEVNAANHVIYKLAENVEEIAVYCKLLQQKLF